MLHGILYRTLGARKILTEKVRSQSNQICQDTIVTKRQWNLRNLYRKTIRKMSLRILTYRLALLRRYLTDHCRGSIKNRVKDRYFTSIGYVVDILKTNKLKVSDFFFYRIEKVIGISI